MPGGSARSAALLLQHLAKSGHEVHGLCPITAATSEASNREQEEGQLNLSITRYSLPVFQTHSFLPKRTATLQKIEAENVGRLLPSLIDRVSPDLLIASHETLAHILCPVARARGIPSVVLLRGSPTWLVVQGRYPEELTEKYLSQIDGADRLIAVAEYYKEGLEGFGIKNCVHIPNFLNLSQFQPSSRDRELAKKWGIMDDDVVVMQASLLHARKRPVDTLESAVLALRENSKLLYIFVGGGEEEEAIKSKAFELGISERVRFVGEVDYAEMPRYLSLSDIVVLPSEGEGLARVYLEAQACERVMIASDIPSAREVIEDGKTGFLFETVDVEALATKTLLAAAQPEMRAQIGAAGRNSIKDFDIETVVERYEAEFWRVLEEAKRNGLSDPMGSRARAEAMG